MPPRYNWASFKDLIYQRYIVEGRTLEETRDIISNDFDFNPSIKTYRTKLKEWDFGKQKCLFRDPHGYDLTTIQLRDIRIHPEVRILFQNRSNLTAEEVESIADEAIKSALSSGQSLRWGAGTYTIANVHMQGILVSERALRDAVKRLDPEGVEARTQGQMRKRGQFVVKGPNRVWSIDANAQTDTWHNLFVELEKEGFFDGGDIDVICLQFIYMEMIRAQIQTFVAVHNTHRIRRQRKREHYLPTGHPVELYRYPPDGIHDYGSIPDPEILTYIFLRQVISEYIQDGGTSIEVLQPPTGAAQWILDQQVEEQEGGIPWEFNLDVTDNEQDFPFVEADIIDEDDLEDFAQAPGSNSSDSTDTTYSNFFSDDGFVLDL
ncbi:hypothetical protein L873DRAFT_1895537 [Choiromyces venosus 120613-1]|uniref:Uncharacterized protein n=1 Tax=Choiromyces venosus 120613-1 TaxID=1336337 RepID=A0A3N4IW64_9PEZI|nr:hypothetical protein L873DRAFT_1895537 [Choiromyces venosus 120613-1]